MVLVSLVSYLHLFFFKSKSKLLLFLSFVILFLLLGFRGNQVGTDTLNYNLQFEIIKSSGILDVEPLWYYLNKFVIIINGDFQHVLILTALLTLIPIYLIAFKISPYPVLSIFLYLTLYYYFFSFNIMRQCLAMSLSFLGIVFYFEKRFKLAVLLICIATLFHYSTLVIVPALIFIKLLRSKKRINFIILQICTLVIGLFFYRTMIALVTVYFYSNYKIDSYLNFWGNFVSIMVMNILFYAISQIVKVKDEWFFILFVYILISNILVLIPFGNRFLMFFGITMIVYLPNLLINNKIEKKYNSLILIFIVLYAIFMFNLVLGSGEIFPYENVLF